jgi:hypothetical protein
MQIIQFLIGASYAALHSFVSYLIPVEIVEVQTVITTVAAASPTGDPSWWPIAYILGAFTQANVTSPAQSMYSHLQCSNTVFIISCIDDIHDK